MIPDSLDWNHLIALIVGMVGTFLTLYFTYRKNKDQVDASGRIEFQRMLDARSEALMTQMQHMLELEQEACKRQLETMSNEIQRLSDVLSAYQRPPLRTKRLPKD